MGYYTKIKKRIQHKKPQLYAYLNVLIPKQEIAVIVGGSRFVENTKKKRSKGNKVVFNAPKVEDNALAMANYLAAHYNLPIYLIAPSGFEQFASDIMHSKVKLLPRGSIKGTLKMLQAKYFFFTHEGIFNNPTKQQTVINLWHGISNKKMSKLSGGLMARQATITVGTSEKSQEFFLDIFNIKKNDIYNTGYPRNDWMINSKEKKDDIKDKLNPYLDGFEKVLIWMPTFRERDKAQNENSQNQKVEAVFSVKNFDLDQFQNILANHHTLCVIKPHHLVKNYIREESYKNILFIDDFWIYRHGISLYQLLACTDCLITDYSSVMIDYTLLDQPILCIADDLEEYKKKRGFYYDDFENYVPSKILKNQEEFFNALNTLLTTDQDNYKKKRAKIRDFYFDYKDAQSSKRIAEIVFDQKQFIK